MERDEGSDPMDSYRLCFAIQQCVDVEVLFGRDGARTNSEPPKY